MMNLCLSRPPICHFRAKLRLPVKKARFFADEGRAQLWRMGGGVAWDAKPCRCAAAMLGHGEWLKLPGDLSPQTEIVVSLRVRPLVSVAVR